jgi:hypothetical protein
MLWRLFSRSFNQVRPDVVRFAPVHAVPRSEVAEHDDWLWYVREAKQASMAHVVGRVKLDCVPSPLPLSCGNPMLFLARLIGATIRNFNVLAIIAASLAAI